MLQFRLMVRSSGGWRYIGDEWQRRVVWSTWSQYATEREARRDAVGFAASLIGFAVIHESEYAQFCAYHHIA